MTPSPLQGGRVEIWLPHVAPFNDETLIQTPLRHLIDGYFGGSGGLSVLQYATTIISKHGVTEDQELHSDGLTELITASAHNFS